MDNNKQLKRKVRTSYLISTVSIAMVLFLLGTVGYIILNAVVATDRMKESVTVEVMLKDGATKEIGERLKALPQVREVSFVSRDQAAAQFKQYIGTDFEDFLGTNPLPDGYRVGMRASGSDNESLAAFETKVKTWEGVDEVVYQRTVVEQITRNINKILIVLILFGGTFFVIAVILLNNTIRAAIYSKRYIINTMKLVGATRWFILRPFMIDSIMQGIFAAILSGLMFVAMIVGLNEGMPDMVLVMHHKQLGIILGAMLILGVLISAIFTIFSVNKFINMKTNRIHIY